MTEKPRRPCKDCVAEGLTDGVPSHKWRDTPWPGPRCLTHHRAKKRATRLAAHARHVEADFEITGDDYWWLYECQGGRCLICQRSRGLSRRLGVDHEHHLCDTHPPDKGCPKCIRALLCVFCNDVIGRLDEKALVRAFIVLTQAPARQWLTMRPSAKYL